MILDLIKDREIDPGKVARGFGALIIDLMEHAPQLAILALAAYADFQTGNIPGMAAVVQQAKPILDDALKGAHEAGK